MSFFEYNIQSVYPLSLAALQTHLAISSPDPKLNLNLIRALLIATPDTQALVVATPFDVTLIVATLPSA